MIIGIEWGRKSIAYERLWDIAEVLGVDIGELFTPPSQPKPDKPDSSKAPDNCGTWPRFQTLEVPRKSRLGVAGHVSVWSWPSSSLVTDEQQRCFANVARVSRLP